MARARLLFALLLIAPACLPRVQNHPTPAPIPGDVIEAKFFNQASGWALTTVNSRWRLWRTRDGGRSWALIPDVRGRVVATPGFDDALVVTGQRSVAVTHDGGGTWASSSTPGNLVNVRSSFADVATGWLLTSGGPATQCMGQSAALMMTLDGGGSWTQVADTGGFPTAPTPGTLPFGGCKQGVYFDSPTSGWIVVGGVQKPTSLVHSKDGGRTWSVVLTGPRLLVHPE